MTHRAKAILTAIRENNFRWALLTLALPLIYYAVQLLVLMIRFHELPNYINTYDWIGNVKTIIQSTPSWRDSLAIIDQEWLLEIGHMNYDWGTGISEWSLVLMPAKIINMVILSALIATNLFLLKRANRQCSATTAQSLLLCSGLGAGSVALSSITMSWVVCCATPTWVVGLSMMGLVGISTALWLQPWGTWLWTLGFIVLLAATFFAAGAAAEPGRQNSNKPVA